MLPALIAEKVMTRRRDDIVAHSRERRELREKREPVVEQRDQPPPPEERKLDFNQLRRTSPPRRRKPASHAMPSQSPEVPVVSDELADFQGDMSQIWGKLINITPLPKRFPVGMSPKNAVPRQW